MRATVVLLLSSFLAGCATVTHGPMQKISVDSDVEAATVTTELCGPGSTPAATTPATVLVSRRATRCSIYVWAPGEREREVRLRRHAANLGETLEAGEIFVDAAMTLEELGIGVLVALPVMAASATVDVASGAIYALEPAEIFVRFHDEDADDPDADVPELDDDFDADAEGQGR